MHTHGWFGSQGYNAQAAVTADQIIIVAEVTTDSPDFGHLEPMVTATPRDLQQAGISETPGDGARAPRISRVWLLLHGASRVDNPTDQWRRSTKPCSFQRDRRVS
jgi:hypothetical protein